MDVVVDWCHPYGGPWFHFSDLLLIYLFSNNLLLIGYCLRFCVLYDRHESDGCFAIFLSCG